ncbi:MAG: cytochrome c biogenesis protein [Caldilineaceae bacterium]
MSKATLANSAPLAAQQPINTHRTLHVIQLVFSVLAVAGMAAMMWAALVYARPAVNLEGAEQAAQRIFYIHMGCNFAVLGAFLTSLISSVAYLITRNLDWDRLTQACIEIGLIFGLGTTITGAIWAKPTWNTYWTWDPRLTTVTITVLIYLAYLLFRNGIDNRETRARFGSIYAIIAFLTLPLTYYSARWFRSIHPVVFSNDNPDGQGSFNVGSTMTTTIEIAALTFIVLLCGLIILRFRQLRMEDRVEELREDVY